MLVGANGSGKSNFVGAFSFLHAIREARLQDYVRRAGGAEQVLHFGSKVSKEIRFRVSFRQDVNQYEIALQPTQDDSLYVAGEICGYRNKTLHSTPYIEGIQPLNGGREAGISDAALTGIPKWVRQRLGLFRMYHVHDTSSSSPMRKTSQVDDNAILKPDGANLAAFLFLLQEKHREEYELIRRTVQRVTPFFDNFLLRPDALNEDTIRLAWKHRESDRYFGAAALSDGTLRFIALSTLFLQPLKYRPAVIVIDEPGLGLHPLAITMLASLVKQAAVETQSILSTQSTLLLDHFQPEDVLVAERVDNGTQLTRVDSSQLAGWLEDYSLGQLWKKTTSVAAHKLTMPRLLVHVEAETEEAFVNEILKRRLLACGYESVGARIVGNARQRDRRGGIRAWPGVKQDILRHLTEPRVRTSMIGLQLSRLGVADSIRDALYSIRLTSVYSFAPR